MPQTCLASSLLLDGKPLPSAATPAPLPVSTARINQLELTITGLVQRLCEDNTTAKDNNLTTELQHVRKALDQANSLNRELQCQLDAHVCQQTQHPQCDCATERQKFAADSIALEVCFEELKKELSVTQEGKGKAKRALRKKERECNNIYDKVQDLTTSKESTSRNLANANRPNHL